MKIYTCLIHEGMNMINNNNNIDNNNKVLKLNKELYGKYNEIHTMC